MFGVTSKKGILCIVILFLFISVKIFLILLDFEESLKYKKPIGDVSSSVNFFHVVEKKYEVKDDKLSKNFVADANRLDLGFAKDKHRTIGGSWKILDEIFAARHRKKQAGVDENIIKDVQNNKHRKIIDSSNLDGHSRDTVKSRKHKRPPSSKKLAGKKSKTIVSVTHGNSLMRLLHGGGEYAKHIKRRKGGKIAKQQQQQQQQQQQNCIVPQLDPYNPEALPFIKYDYVGQKCSIHQIGQMRDGGILSVNLKNVQAAGYMYIRRLNDEINVLPKYIPLTDPIKKGSLTVYKQRIFAREKTISFVNGLRKGVNHSKKSRKNQEKLSRTDFFE